MAAARGKRSQKHHFLWLSEVTLSIFGVQFWGFSVLQRHGVSPPGGDFFHGAFLFGDRKLKFMAAARGKRSQKHHFLWVSEVTLGIFGVQFWGFSVLQRHGVSPPGGDFFHCLFLFGDRMERSLKFIAAARGKRSQTHHCLWVSEATLGIFGVQFWGFSVLQRHGVSPPGGDFFHCLFLFGDRM